MGAALERPQENIRKRGGEQRAEQRTANRGQQI
jgi:hypothetical protein